MKLPMISEGPIDWTVRPFHRWQDEDTEMDPLAYSSLPSSYSGSVAARPDSNDLCGK